MFDLFLSGDSWKRWRPLFLFILFSTLQLGDFSIESVSGGRFRLDGGAMFGVVPKPLWNRKSPADNHNRIQLDTNCLLIRSADALILCDTGFGSKISDKERSHIDAVDSRTLVDNLASRGVTPPEITHVVFSHLHFDHAGGATQWATDSDLSGNQLQVTFPNAVHVVQNMEIDDALGEVPELTGSYYDPEIRYLKENGKMQIVDGDQQLLPGIELLRTGGHTAGHQSIWIRSNDRTGVYLGDLCPTSAHLNVFWTMAYDAHQLEVRRKKLELLHQMAEEKVILFFDHDPEIRAATIRQKNDKAYEVDQVIEL